MDKDARDNMSRQRNDEHPAYWSSRGLEKPAKRS